ncbi:RNA-guided pseudouridylation complex pseudouridine synthase subunit Cbf5 [Candidatus Woesearchaeota archaeon]|jgi:H/ACA ribonucleoprotein complex subunit 4|nr:RNA-guided pseudouridylation complex pseudouridine synthase subunit Cbf5 [Candidatus Woesearchaeota archaeon]MBT5397291.1 RNA-guided pseudouridylation complex pseudouridine synthase subunit Cbf5 [Candidatus Woesearchaeota archaeon]MBT5924284.1 RNA-guided pseudouridylation complex pseudouridine synthase subunit Cbf5 [Candidatus Woesearchaeota archaeon]MBT6367864.1 RNA-guided pseudouridylation complex pseudouridine synthase subunit Cbf5 [Candidatus Woesearchaeota archaeon]MBT7762691.1 RNA-guid
MEKKHIFVKKEAKGTYGKNPEERTTDELIQYGVVNIDKNAGPTSHQTSDYVKKILHISKAGHSGTLDPGVTGVQPIALGRATRVTQFLLTAPKEYVCIMHLHKDIDEDTIRNGTKKFIGKIKQLPPIKSAVKRQLRTREIYEFEIYEIKGRDVLFRVQCQAGTYIRKLCHDIGQELGIGAHMVELRRTQAGPFSEKDNLITLNDLQDAYHMYKEEKNEKYVRYCIQPIEHAVRKLSKCWILDTTLESVSHGRDIAIPGISKLENFKKGEIIAVMSLKDELVCIGEALMSGVEVNTKEKGIAIETKKVFMLPLEGPLPAQE